MQGWFICFSKVFLEKGEINVILQTGRCERSSVNLTDFEEEAAMKGNIRNHKGFTLIELAIVLVIIGIILAAVLKGQDLVSDARAKQFVSNLRSWQVALNIYLDRKGHYPGNNTLGTAGAYNGVICGVPATDDPQADITAAQFVSPPLNSFALGQNTYYIYLGTYNNAYNVLAVCLDPTCTSTLNAEAAKFFESYDTVITGVADATGAVAGGKPTNGVFGVVLTPVFSTGGGDDCIASGAFTLATKPNWLDPANIGTITALVYKIQ